MIIKDTKEIIGIIIPSHIHINIYIYIHKYIYIYIYKHKMNNI